MAATKGLGRIAGLVEKVRSGDQARLLLGEATKRLNSEGYAVIGSVTSTAGVRDAARSLLDAANARAQKVFGELPAGGKDLQLIQRQKVAQILTQIGEAIQGVQDAAVKPGLVETYVGALQTVVTTVAATAGKAAATIAKTAGQAAAAAVFPLVPVLLAVGGGLLVIGGIVYAVRKKVGI